MARLHPRAELRFWWPVIAADGEDEARATALELYGGGTHEGPGLPVRGEVTVVEVAHLHRTGFHDEHAVPSAPPDVRGHPH